MVNFLYTMIYIWDVINTHFPDIFYGLFTNMSLPMIVVKLGIGKKDYYYHRITWKSIIFYYLNFTIHPEIG